ncbi:MAG: hypothetical protein CMG60_03535 [Candidatus Marinimicrobia bacterium]|nr:hypothetical protein [Candidatus Neomarinimicrobiota bacterium]|tara:strand:+ start:1784 stop:2125 length:342 start_codon:yes stop_codon:yes gene_type:complete
MIGRLIFSSLFAILFFSCVGETSVVTINTPTIQCGMCQKNIEVGLGKIKGITKSTVDLGTKTTLVTYEVEKSDLSIIEKTISNLGYQANELAADPKAYETLPACCKIGGMDKM